MHKTDRSQDEKKKKHSEKNRNATTTATEFIAYSISPTRTDSHLHMKFLKVDLAIRMHANGAFSMLYFFRSPFIFDVV